MNEIQIFNNPEFGEIRTLEINNEPWFVGKDVADILKYADPQKAVKMHVDDGDKLTRQIVVSGQNRNVTIINESGLYSLILSSKMPSAKSFKHWVTSEVLPSIRKTGMKDFMFDYHNRYGFLGRHWVEAEDLEEAKEKAKNTCAITGWLLLEGTVKECQKSGAVKAQTAALFEQHARSFIGDSE